MTKDEETYSTSCDHCFHQKCFKEYETYTQKDPSSQGKPFLCPTCRNKLYVIPHSNKEEPEFVIMIVERGDSTIEQARTAHRRATIILNVLVFGLGTSLIIYLTSGMG
jgi:hypothetical protein